MSCFIEQLPDVAFNEVLQNLNFHSHRQLLSVSESVRIRVLSQTGLVNCGGVSITIDDIDKLDILDSDVFLAGLVTSLSISCPDGDSVRKLMAKMPPFPRVNTLQLDMKQAPSCVADLKRFAAERVPNVTSLKVMAPEGDGGRWIQENVLQVLLNAWPRRLQSLAYSGDRKFKKISPALMKRFNENLGESVDKLWAMRSLKIYSRLITFDKFFALAHSALGMEGCFRSEELEIESPNYRLTRSLATAICSNEVLEDEGKDYIVDLKLKPRMWKEEKGEPKLMMEMVFAIHLLQQWSNITHLHLHLPGYIPENGIFEDASFRLKALHLKIGCGSYERLLRETAQKNPELEVFSLAFVLFNNKAVVRPDDHGQAPGLDHILSHPTLRILQLITTKDVDLRFLCCGNDWQVPRRTSLQFLQLASPAFGGCFRNRGFTVPPNEFGQGMLARLRKALPGAEIEGVGLNAKEEDGAMARARKYDHCCLVAPDGVFDDVNLRGEDAHLNPMANLPPGSAMVFTPS